MQGGALALWGIILLAATTSADAQEYAVEDVPSVESLAVAQLKPRTIAFGDHRGDPIADPGTGLLRFEDWARARPRQKQFLSLYPTYVEPTVNVTIDGVKKSVREKLHVYIAQARFVLDKPPGSLDLNRYATLPFLERIDPAIKHKLIQPSDVMLLKDSNFSFNQNPDRPWCVGGQHTICIQSRYQFEGKLPIGIALANKLRENSKPISEYMEFQSEVRLLSPQEVDVPEMTKLTGVNATISGAIEQNIFWVNQMMLFGKFLAVFQQHPTDPTKTVATAFMALAVKTEVLDKKKEYEKVPILRNLVPAQVLVGNSSFNTGNSISAGLPIYVRNRIKAIAGILDSE